jgi:hypothetical protein
MKKSELRQLIREEIQKLREGNIKKGSVVIPYAFDKYGEFIIDRVFKNSDGEISYTGKFKNNGEKREFILNRRDKIITI